MAFADQWFIVRFEGDSVFLKPAFVGAESHRSAHGFFGKIFNLFWKNIDNWIRGSGVDFSGVGVFHTGDMPGKFNGGKLHAVAEAEVRNFVLPGVFDGLDFAFDATGAKSARDDDTVILG